MSLGILIAAAAAVSGVAGSIAGWVAVVATRRRDQQAYRDALREGLGALGDRLTRIETLLEERDRASSQLGTAYQAQQRASAEHVCAGPHKCYWRDRDERYIRRETAPRGFPAARGDK